MASRAYTGKLESHAGSAFRKSRAYVKRTTAKLARRLAKKYGEDTPQRRVEGWMN